MKFRAAFLCRDSGAIDVGFEIEADTDDMARRRARSEEHRRGTGWSLFGLHESIGQPELVRVVRF